MSLINDLVRPRPPEGIPTDEFSKFDSVSSFAIEITGNGQRLIHDKYNSSGTRSLTQMFHENIIGGEKQLSFQSSPDLSGQGAHSRLYYASESSYLAESNTSSSDSPENIGLFMYAPNIAQDQADFLIRDLELNV
jgi:hypothetical protein